MFVKDASGHFEVCGPMVRLNAHWPAIDINHIAVIQVEDSLYPTDVLVGLATGNSFKVRAESIPAAEALYNYIAQFKANQMSRQTVESQPIAPVVSEDESTLDSVLSSVANTCGSDVRVPAIVKMLKMGFTQNEIAEKLGVVKMTIIRDLRYIKTKYGLSKHMRPLALAHWLETQKKI